MLAIEQPKKLPSFSTPYGVAEMEVSRYASAPHAIAITLSGENGPLGTLSINPPEDHALASDEVAIKVWGENYCLVVPALATGHFKPTGRSIQMGYVLAPIWKIIGL